MEAQYPVSEIAPTGSGSCEGEGWGWWKVVEGVVFELPMNISLNGTVDMSDHASADPCLHTTHY